MGLQKMIKQVEDFNRAFDFRVESKPTPIPYKESDLNHKMLKEENDEYLEACDLGDLVETADAIGDELYIVLGKVIKHGLQDKIAEIFSEIHLSNMSKLENGKVLKNSDGKAMKGKDYFKPNIKAILEKSK